MNRLPPRWQLPAIAGLSLLVVVLIVGSVLFVGSLGSSQTPSPSSVPTAPSASSEPSTPEAATRAFFDAVIAARRSDDPSLIEPNVTSTSSSAYATVAAFLAGQKADRKASITTQLELKDVAVSGSGDTSHLTATLLEAGYDIALDSGKPLESPMTLDPRKLTVELRKVGGAWKVDSFETGATT